MLVATWVAFAVAVACGIYLATLAGPVILVIGVLSIAAGVLYTGGPRPYGYAGLGELFVFLFFGLVAVNGSYYVQVERIDSLAFGLSVAVGMLSTAILVVNNVRDIETDRRAASGRWRSASGATERGGSTPALVAAPTSSWWRPVVTGGPWWPLPGPALDAAGGRPMRAVTDADRRRGAECGAGRHRALLAAFSLLVSAGLLIAS